MFEYRRQLEGELSLEVGDIVKDVVQVSCRLELE